MGATYAIVLDATGVAYGSDPDTYVVLKGTEDEGREIVASCFPTRAEAEAWLARWAEPSPPYRYDAGQPAA